MAHIVESLVNWSCVFTEYRIGILLMDMRMILEAFGEDNTGE